MSIIDSKANLTEWLRNDAKANGIDGRIQYYIKLMYGNVGARAYRYLKALRHYEYSLNRNLLSRYWYRLKLRHLGNKYSIAIIPNTVQSGLHLPHLEGGVIINCKSMGRWCTVNTGVVVGEKNKELATIGSNVNLCVGCKIIGGVTIGENVTVAPNAVVVKDVEDNSIVAGVPAKKIIK